MLSQFEIEQIIKCFLETIIVLSILQLIIAFLQLFNYLPTFHHYSITGMFFNPAPFAILLAICVGCLLILALNYLKNTSIKKAVSIAFLLILLFFILYNLDSRSAWIGIIVSTGFILYCYLRAKNNPLRINLITKITVLIICCSLFFFLFQWLYTLRPQSADGRILIWKTSFEIIKQNLSLGIGIGKFGANYSLFQGEYFLNNPDIPVEYKFLASDSVFAFNDFLQIFVEKGIFGAVLFLIIVCLFFKYYFNYSSKTKNKKISLSITIPSAMLIILASGMTSYPLQTQPLNTLFWALIAIVSSKYCFKHFDLNLPKYSVLSFLISMIAILSFYSFSLSKAYSAWELSKKNGMTESQFLKYAGILESNSEFLFEISQYYIQKEDYNKAINFLTEATNYSFRKEYYYSLGNCYERIGNYEKAKYYYLVVEKAIPHLLKPKYLRAITLYTENKLPEFKKLAANILESQPKIENTEIIKYKRHIKFLMSKVDNP
ncbi:O-antigen ligase family protein [Sphingobacterium spiritivorum]|uniref:O-antigen ligase family protein n=2 Tax=Sphingobacterium spiritivorum TaxID=258 RepID=UPI003DA41AA0